MTFHAFLLLIASFLYAILPYSCLHLTLAGIWAEPSSLKRNLLLSPVIGLAGFCFMGTFLTALAGLDVYLVFHCAFAAITIPLLAMRLVRKGFRLDTAEWMGTTLTVLLLLTFVTRSVPILLGVHQFGGGDARFHNILAEKIAMTGFFANSWSPFAELPVNYPQASHLLVAFMSQVAGTPVHEAFNALFPITGTLTVAVICLIAARIFGSASCGLWAGAAYAFMPLWGSLDYYNWGGIPNSLAMLLLCLLVYLVSTHGKASPRVNEARLAACALIAVTILLVHEYTFLVAGMFLAGTFLFSGDRDLRRFSLGVALMAAVLASPLIAAYHLGTRAAYSEVFAFHENPIDVLDIILNMNPAFVVLFVSAMFLGNAREWSPHKLAILAWLAVMAVSFVFLEYLYRAGSLLATDGKDCFTALTPSRLATDMVYPMSILCGWIPLANWYPRFEKAIAVGLAILAASTVSLAWTGKAESTSLNDVAGAASWLRANTPDNAMIVGSLPHIEYLAWRETSSPPLPASEGRRNPAVQWKNDISTYEEWLLWEAHSGRPVFFLLSDSDIVPEYLKVVFKSTGLVIARKGVML